MSTPDKTISDRRDIEALCAEKGMRMTEQRRTIARVLAGSDDHPDVEELYRRCAKVDDRISISTVYRTVRLFEDAGIIERHDFREGRARYETATESHHDHLINLRSGEVIEFRSDEIDRLQAEVARKLGYQAGRSPARALRRAARRRRQKDLMLRALFIAVVFFTVTPLLISLQWLLDKLKLPGWGAIAVGYYRVLCRLLRIHVRVVGEPLRDRAVLFVSNHVSWVDILVIGSIMPVAFVAKREVASWPLVGVTAKMQRTVFVDRTRRHRTSQAIGEIVKRLTSGTPVVLFAEGTSSDGNRVLPFRSALLGAVEEAGAQVERGILLQPMSVGYTCLHGIPMGRQHRPLVAWYGDLDFMPHIKALIARGAVDAVVSYGEPVAADGTADRKAMTKSLEATVRALNVATLRGGQRPAPANQVLKPS